MTSRLRAHRSRCRAPRGMNDRMRPRRVMSCGDGEALVLWAAQGHATVFSQPLAPLLAPPRGWDAGEQERTFDMRGLAGWPMPFRWTVRPESRTYPAERPPTNPPPMRQRGTVGDLAAALRDPGVPDRKSKVRRVA